MTAVATKSTHVTAASPTSRIGQHTQPQTVLLIHGINGSANEWSALAEMLPARYRILTVELPGHETVVSNARPLTMDGCLDAAASELTAVDGCCAHLVGSSFGGAVALALAAERPALVASVTTLGTSRGGDQEGFAALASALRTAGARAFFSEVIPRFSYPPHTPPEVVQAVVEQAARHDIETATKILRLGFCTDVSPYADRVATPLMLVGGSADLTCPPASVRALAETFGTAPTILDGLGHLPHIEDPERTAAELQRFWAESPIPKLACTARGAQQVPTAAKPRPDATATAPRGEDPS